MAKVTPQEKPDRDTPLPIRMLEVSTPLDKASDKSGVSKSDITRMAVAAFLKAHPTPQAVIAAKIKYQASLHAA